MEKQIFRRKILGKVVLYVISCVGKRTSNNSSVNVSEHIQKLSGSEIYTKRTKLSQVQIQSQAIHGFHSQSWLHVFLVCIVLITHMLTIKSSMRVLAVKLGIREGYNDGFSTVNYFPVVL